MFSLRAKGEMRAYRQRQVLAGVAFDELLRFGFPCHGKRAIGRLGWFTLRLEYGCANSGIS